VTRNLQNFISGISTTHAVVTPWPRWIDPTRRLTHLLRAEPVAACKALLDQALSPAPDSWLPPFRGLEADAEALDAKNHIHALLEELPANTDIFIGNSLAIRQLDTHAGCADKPLRFHANRGASGIDGNISTAAGIAADRGLAVALIGDLTCQHDIGGLALTRGLNIVIVVVNNAGGGIFEHLPQRNLPEFVEGWRTPQDIDFEHAAGTFALSYALADSDEAFRQALRNALAAGGPHLIELKQC
jgi:2-succinyl-5-enolpyruvyl-6-hydroxy-3-cyclohexene-1-carboxylate synthase